MYIRSSRNLNSIRLKHHHRKSNFAERVNAIRPNRGTSRFHNKLDAVASQRGSTVARLQHLVRTNFEHYNRSERHVVKDLDAHERPHFNSSAAPQIINILAQIKRTGARISMIHGLLR